MTAPKVSDNENEDGESTKKKKKKMKKLRNANSKFTRCKYITRLHRDITRLFLIAT